MALWLLRPFRLPSLGKARVALMWIRGELERIVRLPKRPGFLINNDPSVMMLMLHSFFGIVRVRA